MSEASNNDIINKEEEKDIPLNVADKEQKDLNKKKKFKLFNFLPEKHRKIYAWILSIIVLIAVTLICHKVFVFEGSMFILYDTDSFSQFMQFFAFLQNAFAKGQPFWSFSYGLGGNVFGEFSYYYTTSPFFYLMLIPRLISAHNWNFQEALYAKMIISLIKQFLSMFFLFALLKYEGRKTINALIGAIIYGASLMFARYCVSFDFFTEAFPWVPLTILGFRIYQRKKKPFVLVLGAALTVGNSFYFGFMSVCLYFAYMVFFLVEAKGKNIKDWIVSILKSCYKYFIYAALSMCIASIFFLPTIYAFFNSDRFAQTWNVSLFFTSDFYKTLPERLFNNRDVLAFPFIIIIMIFVLLKITKVSSETRRKTFFVLFFFILYMFPRVYSFFNGFTYVIDRWLYIFIFSVAYALPNWLEEDERLKLTGFSFAIFGGAFLAAMYATKAYRGAGAANDLDIFFVIVSIISVISVAVSTYFVKKYQYIILRLILLICVATSLLVYANEYLENVEGIKMPNSDFQDLGIQNREEMSIFKDLTPGTDDFYRDIFVDLTSQNSPLNYGYYGVSTFNSLVSGTMHRWMLRDYNILQKIVIMSLFMNLDDRLFPETALGVKYKVCKKDEYFDSYGYKLIRTSNNYDVYENENTVGLDMWYDTQTSNDTFLSKNFAERDAMLLQSVVVDKEVPGIPYASNSDTTKPVEFDWTRAQFTNISIKNEVLTAGKDATMVVPLKNNYTNDNGELIFYMNMVPQNNETIDMYVNGKHGYKASNFNWDYPLNDFTFKFNPAYESIEIKMNEGVFKINKFEMYFNSYDNYEQEVKDRNKYNLENLYVNGGTVRGDINNNERGILALSIPYDKGWSLKVDGKAAEIIKVNRGFTGIVLDPGSHHIEMSYISPWFKPGAVITVSTMMLCAGIYVYNRKFKFKKYKQKSEENM